MSEKDLQRAIEAAFGDLPIPDFEELIGSDDCCDPKGESHIRNALAGRPWQFLTTEFLVEHWAYYCYLSPTAYRFYLPALLTRALDYFSPDGPLGRTVIYSLIPSFWNLYYKGEDKDFRRRRETLSNAQFNTVCLFLGLALRKNIQWETSAAKALRWGWNDPSTPALEQALALYRRWHTPAEYDVIDPITKRIVQEIQLAFACTPCPGDHELCGSDQGDEPAECAMEFRGLTWQQLHPDFLRLNGSALSFLSDEGFRYFLPAFLIADLTGNWGDGDPVFHLTHGFLAEKQEEWLEYSRRRLAGFSREERYAIMDYLRYMMNDEYRHNVIHNALEMYWEPSLKYC